MAAATTATPTSINKRFIVPPSWPPPRAWECPGLNIAVAAVSTRPHRPGYHLASKAMLGEELRRLIIWSERHRRLLARVIFFSTAQIVTVSSSFANPVTHAGQIVDVGLEFWGIFVVTAIAGSFASFFFSSDQSPG